MEKHLTGIHTKVRIVNETEVSEQVIGAGGSHTRYWTKLCPVNGPTYSKVTYDKMSLSCEFIFLF